MERVRSPTSPRGPGSICFRRTRCRPTTRRLSSANATRTAIGTRSGKRYSGGRVRTIRRGSPVYRPGDQGGWANMRAPRTNAVIAHGEDMVGDLVSGNGRACSQWQFGLRFAIKPNRYRRTSPDRGRRKLAPRAASCASLLGAGKYRSTLQAAWGRRRVGLGARWQVFGKYRIPSVQPISAIMALSAPARASA